MKLNGSIVQNLVTNMTFQKTNLLKNKMSYY